MGGIVTVDSVQLGNSATASQNLVVTTNKDGTFKISRGNLGATTQDILTIDANGRIAQPQSVVAFSVYQGAAQSIPSGTNTKLSFNTKEFDTINCFDTTNSRFLPTVAGYYWIYGQLSCAGSGGAYVGSIIYKNGSSALQGFLSAAAGPYNGLPSAKLIYLNGSTDYVELWAAQSTGAAVNTYYNGTNTVFGGVLMQKA